MTPRTGTGMAVDPQVAEAILETLKAGEFLPVALMDRLEKERNLSDAVLKAAILDLLDHRSIEFGPDQKLRLVGTK